MGGRVTFIVMAVAVSALALAAGALAALGGLTPEDCVHDVDVGASGCADEAAALDRPTAVAVSPDGESVYAVTSNDGSVVHLQRDLLTGALDPQGCVADNDDPTPEACADLTDGLASVQAVAVSPDGLSVYVASSTDDAVVRFDRDPDTGALTPKGCIDDNDSAMGQGPDTCDQETDGLDSANGVAVSPDGTSVYVSSQNDSAVVRFNRKPSGALTPKGCVEAVGGADACIDVAPGLGGASAVTVSSDGASVYATSISANAIVRFKRKPSGALVPKDCIDDNTIPNACLGVQAIALDGARSVAVSPDGTSVYVGATNDDAVTRFKRNTSSGALTAKSCVDDNDPPQGPEACEKETDGLDAVRAVTISPDGESVYAVSFSDSAIVHLKRDPSSGALSPKKCVDDLTTGADVCADTVAGLTGLFGVAVSPDGASVYTVALNDDAVFHLSRDTTP